MDEPKTLTTPAPASGWTKYAVEYQSDDKGWTRLVARHDTTTEARAHADWCFREWVVKPPLRLVEIKSSERILSNEKDQP